MDLTVNSRTDGHPAPAISVNGDSLDATGQQTSIIDEDDAYQINSTAQQHETRGEGASSSEEGA